MSTRYLNYVSQPAYHDRPSLSTQDGLLFNRTQILESMFFVDPVIMLYQF
ncbi:hypothetical protein BASP5262_08115 [Bacillus spizizenii]|nr:hypothetical protein DJ97_2942 [Bacillus spizizenii]SPT96210.1 Uncharacterised protein [Bacillus spizizenii]